MTKAETDEIPELPADAQVLDINPMTEDHLDSIKQILLEIIEVQRALATKTTDQSDVVEKLEALGEQIASLGSAAEGIAVGSIFTQVLSVHEPNGVPRFKVSSAARNDGRAGLFFNSEEAREVGGIVYSADPQGSPKEVWGGLFFDQFRQDQVVGIHHSQDERGKLAGLSVWDRPDEDMKHAWERLQEIQSMGEGPERDHAMEAFEGEMKRQAPVRLFAGRNRENETEIRLQDAEGRPRLNLTVSPGGEARIEFLDDDGNVKRTFTAD